MSPRSKCFTCKKLIRLKEQKITCSECKTIQHITCANVSDQRYNLMTSTRTKGKWKCVPCSQKTSGSPNVDSMKTTPSKNSHNNNPTHNTHINLHDEILNSTLKSPEKIAIPTNKTLGKVTPQNCTINVSMSNSFESLNTDEFDLGGNTIHEYTEQHNRSCPGVGTIKLEEYEKLEEKLQITNKKLAETNTYLEKLLLENDSMEKEIDKYKKQILCLTNICRTSSNKKGLGPSSNSNVTENVHTGVNNKYEQNTSHKHNNMIIQQSKIKKIVKKVEETMPNPIKKVIIIADQQGKGLQPCLQSVLGTQFSISCFWKGGAKMLDVLNSCKTEIMSLSKDDYVVVVGGTNDTNPCEYKTAIKTWLNFITNTNIIICEVPFNKSLNEFMLNHVISQLCEQHEYCTFLDLNYTNRYIPRKDKFVTNISRYVLREILRIQNQGKYKDYILDACNKSTQTEDSGMGAANFTNVTPVLVNGDDKIATKNRNVTSNNDLDFFLV